MKTNAVEADQIFMHGLPPSKKRYTDNGNGTVTDNITGLIWLKNANCFGVLDWASAQQSVAKLAQGRCGLHDGSKPGAWRLPTKEEWKAMLNAKFTWPAISNAAGTGKWTEGDPFVGVQSSWYWTASTLDFATSYAWYVILYNGKMRNATKTLTRYVWAVRDG